MLPSIFVKSLTLRHSDVVSYFMIAAILYTLFVVIDITITSVFLIQNLT